MIDVVDSPLNSILKDLSLSNYEIQVMEYLYAEGSGKADEIQSSTSIPLSRVYETLDSLVSKGFARVTEGRPKIFHAEDPSKTSEALLLKEKNEFEEKITKISLASKRFVDEVMPYYLEHNSLISPKDLMTQFSNLEEAETQTKEMIQRATKSIEIFSNVFNWFPKISNVLMEALERGVNVRILVQEYFENVVLMELSQKYQNLEICVNKGLNSKTRGTIVDTQEVLFIIWASEPRPFSSQNMPKRIYRPQYSSNEGIVSVFSNNFNHLWLK